LGRRRRVGNQRGARWIIEIKRGLATRGTGGMTERIKKEIGMHEERLLEEGCLEASSILQGLHLPTFPSTADAVATQSDHHDLEFGTNVCSKGNSSKFIFLECI
jgi:hypothetical protein